MKESLTSNVQDKTIGAMCMKTFIPCNAVKLFICTVELISNVTKRQRLAVAVTTWVIPAVPSTSGLTDSTTRGSETVAKRNSGQGGRG